MLTGVLCCVLTSVLCVDECVAVLAVLPPVLVPRSLEGVPDTLPTIDDYAHTVPPTADFPDDSLMSMSGT